MIVAFQTIASTGGAADPVMLAGGIGTALVTTFWGLLIAIPATSAGSPAKDLSKFRSLLVSMKNAPPVAF